MNLAVFKSRLAHNIQRFHIDFSSLVLLSLSTIGSRVVQEVQDQQGW